MEKAADWQLANPKPKEKPDSWVNATFYAGVMELSHYSKSPRFHDAMVKMAEANHWKLGSRPYHADDHAVGQTYLDLYFQDHDPKMIAPTQERLDYILAQSLLRQGKESRSPRSLVVVRRVVHGAAGLGADVESHQQGRLS
jgi:hypothetical protein